MPKVGAGRCDDVEPDALDNAGKTARQCLLDLEPSVETIEASINLMRVTTAAVKEKELGGLSMESSLSQYEDAVRAHDMGDGPLVRVGLS